MTWSARLLEVERKLGYKLTVEQQRIASKEYFKDHAQARSYWSLLKLHENICESVEQVEATGENASYKTKLDNGTRLPALWKQIEDERAKVFKKNTQAEFDFRSGKAESSFKKSEADNSMERLKAKHGKV